MPSMAEGSKRAARPLWKKRWPWIALGAAAALLALIGPWPVDYSSWEAADYAEATLARVEELPLASTQGPLRVGAAEVDVTPPVGEPLAGYSGREPKASTGIRDRCFARAITVSNGGRTVTVCGGDLLAVLPPLRRRILRRLDLPPEDVFFTATHTHSGPGGYSDRWIDQLVLGEFHPEALERLAAGFVAAIRRSRRRLVPAGLHFARQGPAPGDPPPVRNRIEPGGPVADGVCSLVFRRLDGARAQPLALLVVASPHATCLDRHDRRLSGDYPAAVQRAGGDAGFVCLFAAGAVGSMGPREPKASGAANARRTARRIWAQVDVGPAETGAYAVRARLAAAILPVDLPSQHYRIARHLRLSPVLASYLHDRRTYLHVIRIGRAVLLGMPGDYSGELAVELEAPRGLEPVITSFNGDYVGYLLPRSRYRRTNYEAREMNLFGPWSGELLQAAARRVLRRIIRLDRG